jgi:adenylate cyclase 10
MKADALLIKSRLNLSDINLMKKQLSMYVPKALLPYIDIDQEPWSSELRRVTVLFVNLNIDLSLAETESGLERI